MVERLMPNKTNVLPFLSDSKVNVGSWARVVMLQNRNWGANDSGISEWMVGPIPTDDHSRIEPLSYIYNSGRHVVNRPIPDILEVFAWFNSIVNGTMKDLMQDLLGHTPDFTTMADTPGLMALSNPSIEENGISEWLSVQRLGDFWPRDAFSLLQQGMYAKLGTSMAQNEIDMTISTVLTRTQR